MVPGPSTVLVLGAQFRVETPLQLGLRTQDPERTKDQGYPATACSFAALSAADTERNLTAIIAAINAMIALP